MAKKSSNMIIYLTLVIITVCGICLWKFSGFNHEDGKFNMILVSFLAVTFIRIIIFTPLKFVIMSLDAAWWPLQQPPVGPDENANVESFMDKLRIKLRTLRSELIITESHRNEEVNLKYRVITEELYLTAKVFLVFLGMVLVLFDDFLYFNTKTIQHLFEYNHKFTRGLSSLTELLKVYEFIEFSLIRAFTSENNTIGGAPWIYSECNRLLGVVRLRQLRTENNRMGLHDPVFTERDYMEGWKLPYERQPYTNKFWTIYKPWVSTDYGIRDNLILGIVHHGQHLSYPETKGYINLLSDTRFKSFKILDYLIDKKWLDSNTSALFMDFSLYNADANTFSVCTLWVEQFPFGGIDTHVQVESNVFIDQIGHFSIIGMLMIFISFIICTQFARAFFVKVWYDPHSLKTLWVMLDALIVLLSILIAALLFIRGSLVQSMIHKVEISVMVDFIDFREPARLNYFADVLKGFAVALVTMRLWKVMQFAGTFQLFTETLALAWRALFFTVLITIIFIVALGIAAVTINGNHTIHFSDLDSAIVTLMCFTFGYARQVNPPDLFYGGMWLGLILYAMMGFVVKFLLINLIISMLRAQLTSAKVERDHTEKRCISFLEFLRVEYADYINFVLKVTGLKKGYNPYSGTVAENIQRKLDKDEINNEKRHKDPTAMHNNPIDEDILQLRYRERIERTFTLAAILQTQMELLERLMFGDEDGNLPDLNQDEEPGPSNRKREEQIAPSTF
ncbi:polycystin-2-like [Drosophila rhopaloa]|uniref:Polycystin-2 n=1 Tax=Drosophila rhopaloa TaxID=1041015 RepID=A0ABM5HZN5_DRORH|nr:polycystin-2-like [Drosophila rhopaloa]